MKEIPIEISTRDIDLNGAMEAQIRRRVAKLAKFHDRIVNCRVHVEGPGGHHKQGACKVRLVIAIPGNDVIINRQNGKDFALAVSEAFEAAGRRLADAHAVLDK